MVALWGSMVWKYGGEVWWGSIVEKFGGEIWWGSMVGIYVGEVWRGRMVGKYGRKVWQQFLLMHFFWFVLVLLSASVERFSVSSMRKL